MKEIFTDLYKKVLGFFQTQEEEKVEKGGSNEVAKNRLKLVLMQDRTNLTPYLLERMRGEMIDVLSKYVEMDKEELELNFEQEGDSMALMLSIPVLRAKDEEEINEIIKAEEVDCEQRAKRLAEVQDVADPFNASNQEEAKAQAEAEETEESEDDEDSEDETSVEEEDEDEVEETESELEEETCSEANEDESSQSPDEVDDIDDETTSKRNKKRK